jgi:putative transposase
MKALDRYAYCGHSVLMGRVKAEWQNTTAIARLFDDRLATARRRYRAFVKKGIADGKRDDLVGGGLIRSAGGWVAVKALRKSDAFQKGDERILGDGDFVQRVLSEAKEAYERKYSLAEKGLSLDELGDRVAEIFGIDPNQVRSRGKQPKAVQARSVLCYWATNELGITQSALSKRLEMSPPAISLAVVRGRESVSRHNYSIKTDKLTY